MNYQAARIYLIVSLIGLFIAPLLSQSASATARIPVAGLPAEPLRLVVDTDAGVDDAVALAWLLSHPREHVDVLAVTAVAGNTTVENVANNVLTILDAAERRDIPVAIGADKALEREFAGGNPLVHGPDGFWGVGLQHPHDLSALPRDVPLLYRQIALSHPGSIFLALGPLTNLAQALERYPTEMRAFRQIIVLGGAKFGGNQTPVSEGNAWADPEAFERIMAANLPLTLVPLDAFNQLTITEADILKLKQNGNAVARLVADPLLMFTTIQSGIGGLPASVPDLVAAIYAVLPEYGQPTAGFVDVITADDLTRGQTVIGITLVEKVTMLSMRDPNFAQQFAELLAYYTENPDFDIVGALEDHSAVAPPDADILLSIDAKAMHRTFIKTLCSDPGNRYQRR